MGGVLLSRGGKEYRLQASNSLRRILVGEVEGEQCPSRPPAAPPERFAFLGPQTSVACIPGSSGWSPWMGTRLNYLARIRLPL